MSRIRIELPANFSFHTSIPVRITDINYGGHVGNDSILSLIHEARMMFLTSKGLTELNAGPGVGLIMSDVAIQFKTELFYGDKVKALVAVTDFTKIGFEMCYLLEKDGGNKVQTVAIARTGMICYDYGKKKIAMLPDEFKNKLLAS